MANKKFTAREMDQLRESPYVLDVSPSIVHFSAEFKQLFWQSLQSGKEPEAAVRELGIDPEILGKNRVMGLRTIGPKRGSSRQGVQRSEDLWEVP